VKRALITGAALLAAVALAGAGSTFLHLRVPEPTGDHPVGRQRLSWVDPARPEAHTEDPSDRREVPVTVWYPAKAGTGKPAEYVDGRSRIAGGLVSSGELSGAAVAALRFVRDPALAGAEVSGAKQAYPLILLSPGNLTNAGFYASIAEDLASLGYIVVGVDHPYQVAAVELQDRKVAVYDKRAERSPAETKIPERVADLRFALDRLFDLKSRNDGIGRHLDLNRVGVMGHSNGGIAAAEACRADARFDGCLNIDGQTAGGPFSSRPDGPAPDQPFMFLTKETSLHPVLAERFEAAGTGAYRVVVPAAAHDQFADGALFRPGINPFHRTADGVIAVTRGFSRAFFDHVLLGRPEKAMGDLEAPVDVYVNVYPLGKRPGIPTNL
jgi:dienelactone hydrolase